LQRANGVARCDRKGFDPAGGVFDMLQTLKLGDHLGLTWYDEVMGHLGQSLRSLDNLDALHGLLRSATGTGLDASRTAAQRSPGVFDKVKDAFRTSDAQLQSKFKHAPAFGVDGNWNSVNRERFRQALSRHVQGAETIVGTYRGDRVYHYYNPNTMLNVIQKPDGDFVSGWRLGPDQRTNIESRGSL